MPLPDFHVSEPFTLGIELEMQVVNVGYDLSQDFQRRSTRLKIRSRLENKTTISPKVGPSWRRMFAVRSTMLPNFSAMQNALQAAADHHLEICGGGTICSNDKWQRQEVCDNERYQRTLQNFGYLIQQATVFWSACPCRLRQWR
ncbi:glutamate-cysteine ligase family protein [Shigella sonnei]